MPPPRRGPSTCSTRRRPGAQRPDAPRAAAGGQRGRRRRGCGCGTFEPGRSSSTCPVHELASRGAADAGRAAPGRASATTEPVAVTRPGHRRPAGPRCGNPRTASLAVDVQPRRAAAGATSRTTGRCVCSTSRRVPSGGRSASATRPANAVAFSPDGRLVAVCGRTGRVGSCRVRRHPVATLLGDRGEVYGVEFSPTGAQVLTAGRGRHRPALGRGDRGTGRDSSRVCERALYDAAFRRRRRPVRHVGRGRGRPGMGRRTASSWPCCAGTSTTRFDATFDDQRGRPSLSAGRTGPCGPGRIRRDRRSRRPVDRRYIQPGRPARRRRREPTATCGCWEHGSARPAARSARSLRRISRSFSGRRAEDRLRRGGRLTSGCGTPPTGASWRRCARTPARSGRSRSTDRRAGRHRRGDSATSSSAACTGGPARVLAGTRGRVQRRVRPRRDGCAERERGPDGTAVATGWSGAGVHRADPRRLGDRVQPGRRRVASAGAADGTVRVWDLTGAQIALLRGHETALRERGALRAPTAPS